MAGPSITTPNALDLRAIQTAVANIRQRIELLDASAAKTVSAASDQSSSLRTLTAALSSLSRSLQGIQAQIDALTGRNFQATATGGTIPAYRALASAGGSFVALFNPRDPLLSFAPIGISTQQAPSGGAVAVHTFGVLAVPTAAFDPGRAVYVAEDGVLTQSPVYESVTAFMGVAIDATTMWVQPGVSALVNEGFSPGFEDFMPASVALVKQLTPDPPGNTTTFYRGDGTFSSVLTGPIEIGHFTLATLPSVVTYNGFMIDVVDATGGPKVCRSNGANWNILNTATPVF
jgi:hypothetical protein